MQVSILLTSTRATQIAATIAVFSGAAFQPAAEHSGSTPDIAQDLLANGAHTITGPWKQLAGKQTTTACEFKSEDLRMLQFGSGELIKVVSFHGGWCVAIDHRGQCGLCPPSYLLDEQGAPLEDGSSLS